MIPKLKKLRVMSRYSTKINIEIIWKINRTAADILCMSSKKEIAIKLIIVNERYKGESIPARNHTNKIIGIKIIPPVLGRDLLCNDLLFGLSCILKDKLKRRANHIEVTVAEKV